MRFPFSINRRERIERLEQRADSSYTDTLVAALTANAQGGGSANLYATAALEACAGLVGRAFAAAEVSAPPAIQAALPPAFLELCGRSLIRRGELVAAIDTESGYLQLYPASSHDIDGSYEPSGWRYRLNLAGPSRISTRRRIEAAGVVHIMYSRDPERPWRGNGPLQVAQLAGKLSAETARALSDEASGSVGHLLPVPVDGADATIAGLKKDLRTLRGRTALVEAGDWGAAGQPQTNWEPKRLGADPPQSLVDQMRLSSEEIYAACGLNRAIFSDSEGTASRESWRHALFGLIAPLGRLVESELSDKLETQVVLGWDQLRASDVAGRARAFSSLVGAGMALDEAARVSGVLSEDD